MTEYAKVSVVTTRGIGSTLLGDHPAGSTELQLADRSDFSEDGGGLIVDGDEYLHAAWTGEAEDDVLVLSVATTAAYEDGTRVLALPSATETVATVVIDDAGDGIEVEVPHELISLLGDGLRDGEDAETVELEDTESGWVLTDVVKETPRQDAGYLTGTVPDDALDGTQLQVDISSKSTIIVSETDDASGPGEAGDAWYRVDGVKVVGWWIHDGLDWAPQEVSGSMLAADAINGKTITGATLQTDAGSVVGVKITTAGFEAYGLPGQAVDAFSSIEAAWCATVDSSGNVYTAATTSGNGAGLGTIRRFTPAGVQALEFTFAGWAWGMVVDSSGRIFVADVLTKVIRRFTSAGVQNLQFSTTGTPYGVGLDGSGNIYALDLTNSLVRKYSSTGTSIANYSVTITMGGEMVGFVVDPAGNFYVGGSAIRKYSSTGTLLQTITGTGEVYGMAVDSSGNVYASDYFGYRIRRYNTSGTATLEFVSPGQASGVALDASGYVYATDISNKVIRKFTQARERTALVDSTNGLLSAVRLFVPGGIDSDLVESQVITSKRGTLLRVINGADPIDGGDFVVKRYVDRIASHSARSANTTQSLTSGSVTKITTFGTIDDVSTKYDNGVDDDIAYSSGDFTLRRGGIYLVSANIRFSGNATGVRAVYIYKNGSTLIAVSQSGTLTASSYDASRGKQFRCAAGDVISVSGLQNSGGSLSTVATGTEVSITRIAA